MRKIFVYTFWTFLSASSAFAQGPITYSSQKDLIDSLLLVPGSGEYAVKDSLIRVLTEDLLGRQQAQLDSLQRAYADEQEKTRLLEKDQEAKELANASSTRWYSGVILLVIILGGIAVLLLWLRMSRKMRMKDEELAQNAEKLRQASKFQSKVQEEIIKSEKMAFLGRIFAGIGHELNTPIAAVKSNLQLIDDAQIQEVKGYQNLGADFNASIFNCMIELVIAAYQAQQKPISTHKQRSLRMELKKFFDAETPEQSIELSDIFDELKVYENIASYRLLYTHPKNLEFLDLVVSIATRTRSIFTAMEALQRADKILFSLKTYSFKNLPNEKLKFDLIRNINTILTLHENKLKNITIYKQFDDEVEIEGYPDELTQVWTNLVSNAAYANKYEGNLWIRIRQYSDEVRVEFEDSGGGIDQTVKDTIFEPFETTKPEGEGSGLGLSITRKVIEKHNGKISVENTPSGALFRITLPR